MSQYIPRSNSIYPRLVLPFRFTPPLDRGGAVKRSVTGCDNEGLAWEIAACESDRASAKLVLGPNHMIHQRRAGGCVEQRETLRTSAGNGFRSAQPNIQGKEVELSECI
jgi:hypothetical protein